MWGWAKDNHVPCKEAIRNKCHANSNRCLTSSNKKLLGTSARRDNVDAVHC